MYGNTGPGGAGMVILQQVCCGYGNTLLGMVLIWEHCNRCDADIGTLLYMYGMVGKHVNTTEHYNNPGQMGQVCE